MQVVRPDCCLCFLFCSSVSSISRASFLRPPSSLYRPLFFIRYSFLQSSIMIDVSSSSAIYPSQITAFSSVPSSFVLRFIIYVLCSIALFLGLDFYGVCLCWIMDLECLCLVLRSWCSALVTLLSLRQGSIPSPRVISFVVLGIWLSRGLSIVGGYCHKCNPTCGILVVSLHHHSGIDITLYPLRLFTACGSLYLFLTPLLSPTGRRPLLDIFTINFSFCLSFSSTLCS